MQSGGGVTEVCGWRILWDACPLILLCVYVYARGVYERKRRRRRAHTLPQNTEIYLNCMYTANLQKKRAPTDYLTKVRPELWFLERVWLKL